MKKSIHLLWSSSHVRQAGTLDDDYSVPAYTKLGIPVPAQIHRRILHARNTDGRNPDSFPIRKILRIFRASLGSLHIGEFPVW